MSRQNFTVPRISWPQNIWWDWCFLFCRNYLGNGSLRTKQNHIGLAKKFIWVFKKKNNTKHLDELFGQPNQFSSVTQPCLTLCNTMDCSTPGFSVHHQLPELVQTHVHQMGDAIQPSHPLSSPSPPAFNLSQHQCLFQWVSSSHQVAKVLQFQLQHQSFQWIFRIDFL